MPMVVPFRWDGGFGPPVTTDGQDNRRGFRNQANRLAGFLLRSPGGTSKTETDSACFGFPPTTSGKRGRETAPDEEIGGFDFFFPSGWDASRSGVGVCYPMPGVCPVVMTHAKPEIGAVSEPWQSARLADSTTWVTGP